MWQLKNLNHRTILNYMGKTKITKEIINFSKNSLVSSLESWDNTETKGENFL
jgi:hypothetical protein